MADAKKYYTIGEVAKLIGVPDHRVHYLVINHDIRSIKFGATYRIPADQVLVAKEFVALRDASDDISTVELGKLYTVNAVAKYFGISANTIHRMGRDDLIKRYPVGNQYAISGDDIKRIENGEVQF